MDRYVPQKNSADELKGTASRLQTGGSGVRIHQGQQSFSGPNCPDRLWGLPSLLLNEYRFLSRR